MGRHDTQDSGFVIGCGPFDLSMYFNGIDSQDPEKIYTRILSDAKFYREVPDRDFVRSLPSVKIKTTKKKPFSEMEIIRTYWPLPLRLRMNASNLEESAKDIYYGAHDKPISNHIESGEPQ